MKKVFVSLLMLIMVLSVATAAGPIKLRLSEIHMEGYPTTLADREFARLVKEKTEGRIEITVYSGGVLNATEAEGIEALVLGELGFARVSAAPVAEFVPDLNAIQLPFLYKNSAHMWAVLNGQIGQDMLKKLQSSGSGLIGLCWYDAGSRCYYLTKKITTPKEMAGLKIRMQDNKMMVKMTELLGAVSVTGIGSNDIYPSIMSGIIDGAENNWPTYDTKGDYKAAKYYILDYHTRVPEILLMSEASMKLRKVSASDLEIIKQCAKQTQEYEIAQWAAMEKKSEANVRAAGTVVVELTPAQMQLFQDAMKPLYAEYGAKYTSIINAIAEVGKKF
ncbi:MAG TPA: TRAP transporter substrate-binding protein DctP [Rectinemataceae bacterium]|nr:TRAP transporter substrate-binding protein DctP [Rectinemataceae bacterium]